MEMAVDQIYESTLRAIETARRDERYNLLRRLASALTDEVDGEVQPTRGIVRSRVLYELHMAAFQQATKSTGRQARALLRSSMSLANKSALEADTAGDRLGVLHTEMNASGLILPAMGQWREALEMSIRTSEEAEKIAVASDTSDADRTRAFRVAANCYIHRGRIIVKQKLDPMELAHLREKIDANPVYQDQFRKLESIKADIASFDAYLHL